jgi:excisionase family DNA binding protein
MSGATIRKSRMVSVVAEIMGISKSSVLRLIQSGDLEAYRVKRWYYVFVESIEKYQQNKKNASVGID